MEQLTDKKLSPEQADKLTGSFELDLIAYFKLLEQDVLKKVESGKSVNAIIDDIDKLLTR